MMRLTTLRTAPYRRDTVCSAEQDHGCKAGSRTATLKAWTQFPYVRMISDDRYDRCEVRLTLLVQPIVDRISGDSSSDDCGEGVTELEVCRNSRSEELQHQGVRTGWAEESKLLFFFDLVSRCGCLEYSLEY